MKALVLTAYNHLEYIEAPDPEVGARDVLIEVRACGICGSDVHGMDGSTGRRLPPIIMGHEASGVVAATGGAVSKWNAGERVTFDSNIYCGECYFCRRGLTNLCDRRRVLGVACTEYRQEGAFADYVAVPAHIVYGLPEDVPFDHAALVEPFAVALHAVNRARPSSGDFAVVVGAGVIGLCVIQCLKAAGCGRIAAIDVDRRRLDLALELGAEAALEVGAVDVPAEVAGRTDGRGADLAFEAVGIADTVWLAIDCVRKGGGLALVGNLAPNVELPLQTVVTRELSLYGSYVSRGEYADCLEMIARGALSPDPLISATAPLAEGAEWFDRLRSREHGLIKVILHP
jgi:L-iditol 2-dehydrogenase